MPYDSDAQRRLFHSKNSPVSKEKVAEFDQASKGMKLPEHVQHKAKGGAIAPLKAENPVEALRPDSPYKVLKEDEHHFVVSHIRNPDQAFRVAKFGLGHKTLHAIREHMQHLSGTGPDGSEVKDMGDTTYLEQRPELNLPETNADKSKFEREQYINDRRRYGAEPSNASAPSHPTPGGGQSRGDSLSSSPDESKNTFADKPNAIAATTAMKPPDMVEPREDWNDAKMSSASNPNAGAPLMAPSEYGPEAPPPEKKPAAKPGAGDYNPSGDLKRSMEMKNRAWDAYAAAKADQGKSDEAAQQWYMDQHAAISAKMDMERKSLDRDIDQTIADIKSFKLDPERHWGTGGTAVFNKAMAGIGMILSGAGSAMSGQQNLAMHVIDKAIDRDIDAQKTDLANKNNLLNAYFKKYGNLEQAEIRTKMDLKAMVSAKLDMAAAHATGPLAAAEAQKAQAQALQDYANLKDQFTTHSVQRELARTQMAEMQLKMGLALQQQQVKQAAVQAMKNGHGIDAADVNYLDAEDQKRSVINPNDGKAYFATSPAAAAEVRKAFMEHKPFQQTLNESMGLIDKIGLIKANTPWSAEMGALNSKFDMMIMSLPSQLGFQRLNEKEIAIGKEVFDISKLREPLMRDKLKAALGAVGQFGENKLRATVTPAMAGQMYGVNTPGAQADLSNAFNRNE